MSYNSHHHARTKAKNVCHASKLIGEKNHLRYPAQMVSWTLRNHPAPRPLPSIQTEEWEQTTPKILLNIYEML